MKSIWKPIVITIRTNINFVPTGKFYKIKTT